MDRVRKFLIVKDHAQLVSRLPESALAQVTECEGWHQTWDTAVQLINIAIEGEGEFEVAISDQSVPSHVIAIFSHRNLESLADEGVPKTKWRSLKVSTGSDSFWCNFNYSDYGWGWVSGAQREVPFRLRYFERQAKVKHTSLVLRTLRWMYEVREWVYGHGKNIG